MMLVIKNYTNEEQAKVRNFVLEIQNVEFKLGFEPYEQPDLLDTAAYYKDGSFWLAYWEGELVGTLGLQKLDNDNAILRKMFVKPMFRGKEYSVAQQLFTRLLDFARENSFKQIWLDSPAVAEASHRFYVKNSFQEVGREFLPNGYKFPDRKSKIFRLELGRS